MMTELEIRKDICRVGRSLFDRGYVHATAGNISARLSDGSLRPMPAWDFLSPKSLQRWTTMASSKVVIAPAKLWHFTGRFMPPKKLCLALSILIPHTWLPLRSLVYGTRTISCRPSLLNYVMKVGHVPLVPYHRPGDPAVGEIVAQIIQVMRTKKTPIRAVMIDRLGPNVWHSSLTSAMAALEELEETARLWLTCTPKPEPLSPAQIDELRVHFGASW